MPGRMKKQDPMELQIELALSPGEFIRGRACYSFVSSLEGVDLENLSHYATEPVAVMLDKTHPELAARLWSAQALRIVDAGKSKYYDIAAGNLQRARRCWLRAGLAAEWEASVRQIRAGHFRKRSFIRAFERVANGEEAEEPPSFLERAKDRWGVHRRGGRS